VPKVATGRGRNASTCIGPLHLALRMRGSVIVS